ncbi:crotonase/enoyl-CoA hydratase family protein [Caballeronia sp. AZ7_KS35]|uniref:crotonase/enoyl-CoA hydratase family protein n=1 Tax=Caballeronia sp. AZ7_KS35 TaxID=2921762 RepID=UPI002027C255|nr:crotonase/enoyl-CoA hydratase family protein [Caballeronia sp. AZ7_KS35]
MDAISYEVDEGIATITLNRPDSMNALTYAMGLELIEAFEHTDADDAVKAVIVTGAGERAFCAGADLSAGQRTFDYAARDDQPQKPLINGVYPDTGGRIALRIFDSLKPVIGAVNGVAAGFGATLLLPMDIRIASDDARFGFVFARRGIVPETASSWFLPRIVGISTALDWCYSGRVFGGQEALARGLVSAVHTREALLPAARELARSYIAASAPVSIALTRQMMWKMLGADHPVEAHKLDSRGVMARGQSTDAKEGVASFKEKRPPEFTDRVSTDMPAFYPWWRTQTFE